MVPRLIPRLALLVPFAALLFAACEHSLAGPGALVSITVTRNPDTLAISTTRQFIATGRDADGNVLSISPTWSVAASGGTITSAGLFSAGTVIGTFANTITATASGIAGTASVTVTVGPVASITVTRNPDTLAISTSRQFSATGRDAGNNVVGINPTWSVAASGGTITGAGLFAAGTVLGTFTNTVTATAGGIAGTASVTVIGGPVTTITVTPATITMGRTTSQTFVAVGRDAANNVVTISPNWSVAAGGGTINAATGVFTAGNVSGTYTNTVRASVGSINGTATVTVSTGSLASITVAPNPGNLAIGATQTFTATGRDNTGNTVSVGTVTWTVVAGGGSIVSGSGLFTAGGTAGTFTNTVRATSGTVSGFATVSVGAGVLATITVTPTPVTMATGTTQQFTAVGRDASGNVVPISPIWSEVGAGTIDSLSGVFVAGAAGAFADTVRATSGSISGVGVVNIVAGAPLAAIVVTPNPANVLEGSTVQFTATGLDASGAVVPISPAATWSVVPSMSAAGTINSVSGLFTAGTSPGTYSNAVQATSGSISGFATVNVNASSPVGPSLGAAATHGILAGSAVTCAGAPGTINADASVWPGSAFTGFPPCVITGATHAADAVAQTAQEDLTTAYLALQAMACGTTITADLGGTTLAEGVYCSGTSVGVTGTVTLTGNANSVFVIQAASTLTTAGNVVMIGGAQAKNVYWVVGSSATLGTGSAWQGNVLALTSITLVDNATLFGRALARNGAVSLGTNNTITLP